MATSNSAATVRWLARILSIGSFLFIGTFVVGELAGGTGPAPRPSEWLGLLFFPIGLLTGLALAWKKELAGGLMAILSVAAFYVWDYVRSGTCPTGLWFLILSAPGLLFIIASKMGASKGDKKESTDQNSHAAAS